LTDNNNEVRYLDPVKAGIVNRIAEGTVQNGFLKCAGGLLVEGRIEGDIEVGGMLVLAATGEIVGNVRVLGTGAVLAGKILPKNESALSEVEVCGIAELGESLIAKANVSAGAFKFYTGAQIEGHIKTLPAVG